MCVCPEPWLLQLNTSWAPDCRYLEDEEARKEDEDLVAKIDAMELHEGSEEALAAAVRAFEGRAQSVQDCAHAHEALGAGADPLL